LRRGVDLGLVHVLATLAVEALFPIAARDFAGALVRGATSPATLNLLGVTIVTVALGRLMAESGSLRAMTRSLGELVRDYRLVLAVPPALVGLLPMPAGALVSAPLVNEAAGGKAISPEKRTFINYWFRHVWEYVWPLYPGLLISSALLGVPVRAFAAAQYPLTLVAILLGLVFLHRELPREAESAPRRPPAGAAWRFAASLWPFAIILVCVLLLRVPLLAALCATTLLVGLAARLGPARFAGAFGKSLAPRTLLLVISVMMFKEALQACGALDGIPGALAASGVPSLVPLFAAPFLVGLLTGVNQAYVAITFPMLMPLMGGTGPGVAAAGSTGALGPVAAAGAAGAAAIHLAAASPAGAAAPLPHVHMPLVMFAYVSGFLGILLSPTHLCLSLTREYFAADFRSVYRFLAWPVAALFLTAISLLFLGRP
jgi:integral membrane protein (TIGR00529 family)